MEPGATILLGWSQTATALVIAQSEKQMMALSRCHLRMLHWGWDNKEWICSECSAICRSTGDWGPGSSVVPVREGMEANMKEWLSYWTGFPEECLAVSIRS